MTDITQTNVETDVIIRNCEAVIWLINHGYKLDLDFSLENAAEFAVDQKNSINFIEHKSRSNEFQGSHRCRCERGSFKEIWDHIFDEPGIYPLVY